MTQIEQLHAKLKSVQTIAQELSSSEFGKSTDPEVLYKRFLLLQRKFHELTKLTNAGKATPDLRTKNLKILKKWLDNYSNPANIAIEHLPQKYQNKNVTIDEKALKDIAYFKNYIGYIIDYMEKLGPRYDAIKDLVDEVMEKGKMLAVHMNKFVLLEEDLPSYDLFAADDETEIIGDLPTVSPAKMIKTIQTIINKYYQFSVKASEKYKEVLQLAEELEETDLGEFLTRTNHRNKLIQQLMRNLAEANRILYQGKIPHKEHFREQYYDLIEQYASLLPEHVASRLLAVVRSRKGKGQFQTAVEQSLEGVRKYNPQMDQAMRFRQSPHIKTFEPKAEPEKPGQGSMEERIDRKLRHQELAELSQREGKPLSPDDKIKYEKLWRDAKVSRDLLKVAEIYCSKL